MALSNKRATKIVELHNIEMAATASVTYYQNGLACIDTSTGLIKKGQAGAGLVAIGLISEGKVLGAGGGTLIIELFRAIRCVWMKNSGTDAVDANDVGKLCYIEDDDTVRETSNSGANAPAGRVWKVDSVKGVLVEFLSPAASAMAAAIITALTDNTAGTANNTLQAVPDPADSPATADALRDDLVANALPAIRNNFADVAAKLNELLFAL